MRRELTLAALMVLAPAAAQSDCTVSASGVAFGVYNPFSATSTDATGTVTLSCSSSSGLGGYKIALSMAVAAAMPGEGRAVVVPSCPTSFIRTPRTADLGRRNRRQFHRGGADNIPLLSGTSIRQVYGRIAARHMASPGPYSDFIVVTAPY
jgi:spore coat protein U-like protein